MKTIKDIAYSKDFTEDRVLDVYLPEECNGICILLIHGGGFQTGSKESWRGVPEWFTSRGYICVTPTYRKRPGYVFPAWVEDIRLAMQYTAAHAEEYGFSKDRIITMGSSAGGYQALVLAAVNENSSLGRTDELTDSQRPCAVISYCPVVRMLEGDKNFSGIDDYSGTPESEILNLIEGTIPPMLFVHGTGDALIPFAVSEKAVNTINSKGGMAELAPLDGVGHGFGYGTESEAQKLGLAYVESFLNRIL